MIDYNVCVSVLLHNDLAELELQLQLSNISSIVASTMANWRGD